MTNLRQSDDYPIFCTDTSPDHKTDNWPAVYDAAKHALAEMVDTHCVNPLPAYDMNGRLLKPSAYRENLQGAVVICHLNLSHWFIKGDLSDTYVANVVNLRVLVPPKPKAQVAPHKRKLCHMDPMAASKRQRG
ncbi:hypothetical protein FPV67DRAFT_1673075 [Lyophyllum atratum]|nr:hypothetical protein FPV67DRAFT_1673075 [Lyophyllum atratum]